MTSFIPGLDLSELFYREAIAPILANSFPTVKYASALIGSGSEVLGLDNEMSSDHHWGPRALLFLTRSDLEQHGEAITETLRQKLPKTFRGFPTSFTEPDPNDHGTQLLDSSSEGPVNHRVEILSIEKFFAEYIGFDVNQEITAADWLTFPEQKLATITAGKVFHDEIGLAETRERLHYYPHDVWLYLLACGWNRIEQEEHLMGRAGFVRDEIGSAIIASRLVRDLMRLCFLMEKRYAPYPKWFGTMFRQLRCASTLEPIFVNVLSARSWKERQKHLCDAYEFVARSHNELAVTEAIPDRAKPFFGRPFQVISMGVFSDAIKSKIADPSVKAIASRRLIGSIDQWSDSTDLLSDPGWRRTLRGLYI